MLMNLTNRILSPEGVMAAPWRPSTGMPGVRSVNCLSSLPFYTFTGVGLGQRHAESIANLPIKDRRHVQI